APPTSDVSGTITPRRTIVASSSVATLVPVFLGLAMGLSSRECRTAYHDRAFWLGMTGNRETFWSFSVPWQRPLSSLPVVAGAVVCWRALPRPPVRRMPRPRVRDWGGVKFAMAVFKTFRLRMVKIALTAFSRFRDRYPYARQFRCRRHAP